jgi:hypothetical protein
MENHDVYGQQKLGAFYPQIAPVKTFEPLTTTREERGLAIAQHTGNIRRIDDLHYEVKAQSQDGFYSVGKTEIGWICSCPDYQKRGVKCKHIQMQIFHNYVRPHEALKGKTPADACGIEVIGDNKWLTLIQNASQNVPTVNSGF